MKSTAVYVYCVIDRGGSKKLASPPPGLPNAEKPRVVELDDFAAAVICDVPLPEYSAEEIEKRLRDLDWVSRAAIAHEAVVEYYAKQIGVVPMKMFSLFSTEERAIADLAAKKKSITRVLERVRGREEWGVRLAYDEARAIASASKSDGSSEAAASSKPTGKQFLMRKKGERDVKERFRANAARDATALFDELAVASADSLRRAVPPAAGGPRVVLDAAFLVARDQAERFFARVDAERARLGPHGYEVVLTGPWPPYNFVQEGS